MCTGDTCANCNSCNNCTSYNGGCPSGYTPCITCVGTVSCSSNQTGCGGGQNPIECITCVSDQGGQNPCNGCVTGEYTPENPEEKPKEIDIDCLNRATGGTDAGLNTGCKSPPYNAADIPEPSEYKGPPAWDQLSDNEKVDKYRELGYKVKINDTPEDVTGVEFKTAEDIFPGADHIQTEWDKESGTFIEYVYDKDGKLLGTFKSTDRGETFVAESVPDENGNVDITTGIKVNKDANPPTTDISEKNTKEYDSKGEETGKETKADGTTTITNPETGEKVNVDPQPAGC